MEIKIPTYQEAEERMKNGQPTPLDFFVINQEPAGEDEEKLFREGLLLAIEWCMSQK